MTRREKIIVGAMAAAVLYAGYVWFFSGGEVAANGRQTSVDRGQLESIIKQTDKAVADGRPSDLELYKIAQAEEEWTADPFYKRPDRPESAASEKTADDGPQVLKRDFRYSGYVAMGKRRLAVINGMEYAVGEQLEDEGYFVVEISPKRVIIEHRVNGAATGRVIVPISESMNFFNVNEAGGTK